MARRLAAIMFTDIAGYTPLSQKDEFAALRLVRDQDRLVRGLLEIHQGRLVKSIGDGLLIDFPSALGAVECAVDLQRLIKQRNTREAPPELRVRIGIHLGDVEEQGADIFGDSVNVASRLEALAEPGCVCVSEPVYAMVHNKVRLQFENLGSKTLKGVEQPIGVYRVISFEREPALPIAVTGQGPSRLAVLPLVNMSRDQENEYFADGMTEELISVISQIKGLRVISRTTSGQYKGANKSVAQIGAELGVDSVLEGSVRRSGDRLRITVQLIDSKTDEHRWAEAYDRKVEDIFAIQAEVAERTAAALQLHLLAPERAAIQVRPTVSLAAYESYLRGVRASQGWFGPFEKAQAMDQQTEEYFEAAIREDPNFSAAYSHLADHLLAAMGLTRSISSVLPRIRELVSKALELTPTSSDAHTAAGNLAFQGDHDWTRAEAEFQQAISLNPSSTTARHWYGYLLYVLQRFGEARKQYREAIELDPLWLGPRIQLIYNSNYLGDLDSAIVAFDHLLTTFGDNSWVKAQLALLHAYAGHSKEALALVEALGTATDPALRDARAWVLYSLGKPAELRALCEAWEQGRWPVYASTLGVAEAYVVLGEREKGLTLLEKDFREGERLLWHRYQHPTLDPVRQDARFLGMLRELNLPLTISRPVWPDGAHPPR